jgi:hypothetical protein
MFRPILTLAIFTSLYSSAQQGPEFRMSASDRLRYEARENFSPDIDDRMDDLVNRLFITADLSADRKFKTSCCSTTPGSGPMEQSEETTKTAWTSTRHI